MRITEAEFAALTKGRAVKPSKYRAIKTEVDGVVFDSKKEAGRYRELKFMERAGEISELELQPKYLLEINGVKIGTYKGDFKYREGMCGKYILEDVKGIKTPVYRLKAKLVKALHNIEITET
jgi:hypothetical protein